MRITDIRTHFASQECYSVYADCMFEPTYGKFCTLAAELTADENVYIFGCMENDIVRGILALRNHGGTAEICGIAVDRAYRGHGIGSALVRHALGKLKINVLYAETDDDAIEFYIKCGFSVKTAVKNYGNTECVRYLCTLKKKENDTIPEIWDIVDEHGNPKGYTHERGVPMQKGDYHPSVIVWITNQRGEFLISRRAQGKRAAGMWEPTGGCTLAGEDQLTAALREAKEELGITLRPENGTVFKNYTYPHSGNDGWAYITVWLFRQEVSPDEITLQPEETDAAEWMTEEKIRMLIAEGKFVAYDYTDALFEFAK